MDFTYLYDEQQADFAEFTGGVPVSAEQVFDEIGRPEDWTHRDAARASGRSRDEAISVAEQLVACRRWEPAYEPIDEEEPASQGMR